MPRIRIPATTFICSLAFLIAAGNFNCLPAQAAEDDFARWEPAIRKFEEADRQSPPPQGAVLFVGSSSIRLWDLEKSFPKLTAVNRGFGGSQIADSVHFADRIIAPHKPRTIVLYAGDNDIARGKSPQQVADDYTAFVEKVRAKMPDAKIVFIAIKPSIQRWKLVGKMREANRLIKQITESDERQAFVDIDTPMLGDDGKPRQELFQKDGLHLNEAGYKVWAAALEPHLAGGGG